jgi:hypothetical protein
METGTEGRQVRQGGRDVRGRVRGEEERGGGGVSDGNRRQQMWLKKVEEDAQLSHMLYSTQLLAVQTYY